jgi:addiction module HigA family antidote
MIFARHLGVPARRVSEIVRGKRGVTADLAWLFAEALGTTPELWINLQTAYDLARSRPQQRIAPLPAASLQLRSAAV